MNDDQGKKQATQRWVTIATSGKVGSSRYHLYRDCSFISDVDDNTVETVGERESKLLGLKVCSVCERRKTGGPAIEALKEIIGSGNFGSAFADGTGGNPAWVLLSALKERGFYIASRKKS